MRLRPIQCLGFGEPDRLGGHPAYEEAEVGKLGCNSTDRNFELSIVFGCQLGRVCDDFLISHNVATVLKIVDFEVDWHHRRRGVVLELSQAAAQELGIVLALQDLIEVRDSSRMVFRSVVGQANVEEA